MYKYDNICKKSLTGPIIFSRRKAHRVIHSYFSGYDIRQLALNQLSAYTRDMVDKHVTVEVVALMLDYAGQES